MMKPLGNMMSERRKSSTRPSLFEEEAKVKDVSMALHLIKREESKISFLRVFIVRNSLYILKRQGAGLLYPK